MKNKLSIKNCLVVMKYDFKFTIKSFLIWLAVLCGITTLYMALFPMMREMLGTAEDMMPPGFTDATGVGMFTMSSYTYYFGMIFKILLTIIGAYAIITSAGIIHDEEQRGSIDFLLSHNVSRSELIISKLSTTFLKVFILQFAVVAVALIIGAVIKDNNTFDARAIINSSLISLFALIEYVSFGFLIAVFTSKKTKSVSIALAVFFLLYIIGYLSVLGIKALEFTKYLNPVDMVDPNAVISSTLGAGKDSYNFLPMIFSILISVASLVVGTIFYNKKDL